jgi:hypothetical protein
MAEISDPSYNAKFTKFLLAEEGGYRLSEVGLIAAVVADPQSEAQQQSRKNSTRYMGIT